MVLLVDYSKRRAENASNGAITVLGRSSNGSHPKERLTSKSLCGDVQTPANGPMDMKKPQKTEGPNRRISRSERRRAVLAVAVEAPKTEEAPEETNEQQQEMSSLLDSMPNLGAPAKTRVSRAERRKQRISPIDDETMPLMRTSTAPVAPSAPVLALPAFGRCETNELIQEHRHRRPSVLVETPDDSDLEMSNSSVGLGDGDDDDASIDFGDLLGDDSGDDQKQKDWSKPSRRTVDKDAPSTPNRSFKTGRRLSRSASASHMNTSLSSITEGAGHEEEEEKEESSPMDRRAALMFQSRGHQSISNLSTSNLFVKKERPKLGKKDVSFTLRRGKGTPRRAKSMEDSISSMARFEQSLSNNLTISTASTEIPSPMKDVNSDTSNDSSKEHVCKVIKARPGIRRVRTMDSYLGYGRMAMSMSNLDVSGILNNDDKSKAPEGYGVRDEKFGHYEGLPEPPAISDPTSLPSHHHDHKHTGTGCNCCDRRLKLTKSTSVSQLLINASVMDQPDAPVGHVRSASRRPGLGSRTMSMSQVVSKKEEEDNDIPINILCTKRRVKKTNKKPGYNMHASVPDLKSMEWDYDPILDSETREQVAPEQGKGIPDAQELGYGDDSKDEPRRSFSPMRVGGSLTHGDDLDYANHSLTTGEDSNAGRKNAIKSKPYQLQGQRRAASMSYVSNLESDTGNEDNNGRPSMLTAAMGRTARHAFAGSARQASRRNLMGTQNQKMDTSGFVTGSRIRRIDDASQLLKRR